MGKKRTIYFNDARHYYLFVFEPPMTMEDAWLPVDEVSGTGIDTFVYGASRVDGLFYPSKAGTQFKHGEHGVDSPGFKQNAYWRLWHNMKSLEDRGLDVLQVLIDRAHEKGMDFFSSLRLSEYTTMDPAYRTRDGGGGWAHKEVRDYQLNVLREMAVDYNTEGIELDFAAGPGGSPPMFPDSDTAQKNMSNMTEWVASVGEMVHGRTGSPGEVGARVYPTEKMNLESGFDVKQWLKDGSVDFVVPMLYGHMLIDTGSDISWLVNAANESSASVYAILQPHYTDDNSGRRSGRGHATTEMLRAAATAYLDQGADGTYAWFLPWPVKESGRSILSEMADRDRMVEGDKHYVASRATEISKRVGLETDLPIEIEATDVGTQYEVRLYVSDDIVEKSDRIQQVTLRLFINDVVSEDKFTFTLNGSSLADESVRRYSDEDRAPYWGQWLEFDLKQVHPQKGWNTLTVVLDGRPTDLISSVVVEDVELIIKYGHYPAKLDYSP